MTRSEMVERLEHARKMAMWECGKAPASYAMAWLVTDIMDVLEALRREQAAEAIYGSPKAMESSDDQPKA